MIFVLLFVLLFGFLVYKRTYKTGFLKNKKKFGLAKGLSSKRFWALKPFLFNEESKVVLKKHGKRTAKKVDEILSKVRLNCPKDNLSEKERKFFYGVLEGKPVYIIKDTEKSLAIQIAISLEEFYAVDSVASNNQKKISYAKQGFCTNKINYIGRTNKKLLETLKKLDINLPLPQSLETVFLAETIVPKGFFKKSSVLAKNYLLEKHKHKDIEFFVYNFFVGSRLIYLLIKNKTNKTKKIEFDYFHDLANKKNNYFEFYKKHNFVLIKNLETGTRTCFNFSCQPKLIKTSAVKGTEKSNLPCVMLNYKLVLPPFSVKNASFLFSKTPQPLALLSFKGLLNSDDKLKEVFFYNLDFLDIDENKFFSQIITQAKIALLKKGKEGLCWQEGTYVFLKKKFANKEIDALCFYLSVGKNLIVLENSSIKINPYFFNKNIVIKLKDSNSIYILKQNLKVPFLFLDGVKYYNHFTIPLEFLKNKSAKIHV